MRKPCEKKKIGQKMDTKTDSLAEVKTRKEDG